MMTAKRMLAVCMACMLVAGCGRGSNTFQKVEDIALFGSDAAEAGELLGVDLSGVEPAASEDSEQLEVYPLPGTWQIGDWQAEVELHFLTVTTPKGIPLGLEMITMDFPGDTDLEGLWDFVSDTWNLEGTPSWSTDEEENKRQFSWMSQPLALEEAERLKEMAEDIWENPMYPLPYLYMEGRVRQDGSVLLYVFSQSGALKHHEKDWE